MKKLFNSNLPEQFKNKLISKDNFFTKISKLLESDEDENFREFEQWTIDTEIECKDELLFHVLESAEVCWIVFNENGTTEPFTHIDYFWELTSKKYNEEQVHQIELLLTDIIYEEDLIEDFENSDFVRVFKYLDSVPHKLKSSYVSDGFNSMDDFD